ncbi:DNA repair exonuclease [Pseudoclavibacter sp. CFCC 13796]|uniref:metallophosphoesterase family protein n=1 Tax=Pseudoclavibacter sp. CFCC 13796 TaxID=2615179 RepID=UPI0013018551|nr:metallophosphoesterase [Pseudoclavibacter sp. CFCC 13796]KAB1661415.1 DNA repair exonuclease [Pseudoclavibacter sp. CFCC 13796]
MRFLATADWQLGMSAGFLEPEARPRFAQARFDVLQRITRLAAERKAQFVVVCGDVFETNQLDRSVIARTFEALRDSTVPIYLLPGNHDPLDSASIYDAEEFTARRPEHVHVIRDSTPVAVAADVELVGAPWFSKRPDADLVAAACADLVPPASGVTRVMAGHGAVATLNPDATDPATIDDGALGALIAAGMVHVAVLGDRHATAEVATGIWYPGTPEVTARREVDPGNVLVVDVDPDADLSERVQVERVHVGAWRFETVAETLQDADDLARLRGRLERIPDKARTGVWLMLQGTLSTSSRARLDALIDEFCDLFALIKIWESHSDLVVRPDDGDFSDLHLTGFASEALTELIGRAEEPSAADARTSVAVERDVERENDGETANGYVVEESDPEFDQAVRAALEAADGENAGGEQASGARTAQDALSLLYRLTGGAR